MNNRAVPKIAIALLVVGVLGIAATTVLQRSSTPVLQGRAPDAMDAMFIEEMVPHHQDAIDMAEMALGRSERPEIMQLAEDVIRTQSAEIDQMRAWYREWYGADVPESGGRPGMMGRGSPGMMRGMMWQGTVDLEALEEADEFDKVFLEAMVPHHEMGVMMSRMAGSVTRRPELRELTRSIERAQRQEIADMRRWYEEWYGRR